MEYTIISHNNETKEFQVKSNNVTITLNYPVDVMYFDELTTDDIDIIVSGFSTAFNQSVQLPDTEYKPILIPKIGTYLE